MLLRVIFTMESQRTSSGFEIKFHNADTLSWEDAKPRFISPFANHQKFKHPRDLEGILHGLARSSPAVKPRVLQILSDINEDFKVPQPALTLRPVEQYYVDRFSVTWEGLSQRHSFELARCIDILLEEKIITEKDLQTASEAVHAFQKGVREKLRKAAAAESSTKKAKQ